MATDEARRLVWDQIREKVERYWASQNATLNAQIAFGEKNESILRSLENAAAKLTSNLKRGEFPTDGYEPEKYEESDQIAAAIRYGFDLVRTCGVCPGIAIDRVACEVASKISEKVKHRLIHYFACAGLVDFDHE